MEIGEIQHYRMRTSLSPGFDVTEHKEIAYRIVKEVTFEEYLNWVEQDGFSREEIIKLTNDYYPEQDYKCWEVEILD